MAFAFKKNDFAAIGKILSAHVKGRKNNIRFEMKGKSPMQKMTLEIYPNIEIGKRRGNLISVYTPSTHLQLHFCTGFVVSKMLGEVTFVGERDGKLAGLIVERGGGCSLYANVDREMLSGDFTQLGPEVMLSGIALSLTDTILPENTPKRRGPKRSK